MNATTTTFAIGDKVVRKSNRYRTVGTVVFVGEQGCRVKWDTTQDGLVRIGSGTGISSFIKMESLVAESEFVARPISKPTAEDKRGEPSYLVDLAWHPSGRRVGEYGVNLFRTTNETEAVAKFEEWKAAHPGVELTIKSQTEVTWVPTGCRKERTRYEWKTIATA